MSSGALPAEPEDSALRGTEDASRAVPGPRAAHPRRSAIARVLAWELALLYRHTRQRWAAIGLLFVPALYALIYLASVWDPAALTRALPVGLVNSDVGAVHRDQSINLGAELVGALASSAQFDYRRYASAEAARDDVRNGTLDFMLQVPPDFSRLAVPGQRPGAASLVIVTSEGNNYTGAGFAKRFAPEATAQVNAMLNEARWRLVLDNAAGSERNLQSLRASLQQLSVGADELHGGVQKAREASQQWAKGATQAEPALGKLELASRQASEAGASLAGGMRQMGGGLRALESRRPSETDLQNLRQSSRQLLEGQRELARGQDAAHSGSQQLHEGIGTLRDAADEIPLLGGRVVEAATELRRGSGQLVQGLGQLREGQAKAAQGQQRLDESLGLLTDGLQRSGSALAGIVSRLPDETRIEQFQAGLRELALGTATLDQGLKPLWAGSASLSSGLIKLEDGSARLATGLALVQQGLPGGLDAPAGSAMGLAQSVRTSLELLAPVPNHGTALTPNFVPLALWVGAVMAAFLFHFRRLPQPVLAEPRWAQVVGKLLLPTAVVLSQAFVMGLMLVAVLGVRPVHPLAFAVVLGLASLTFLCIVFMLVRLLGDLGKVLAILLLIVQIGAAGALMPIQLTSEAFQMLHPAMPFTWVVKAFRAAMFDAYGGQWLEPAAIVAAAGLLALAVAVLLGRWRAVPPRDWRPALDMD
jgi:putative membrane protein